MNDYAWGVITPFIATAALALALGLAWLLVSVARHLWAKTHFALMDTVTLSPNRTRIRLKGEPEDVRPEHLESANLIRDALLESPRLFTLAGLGWRLALVRESRAADENQADTDEVLS